MQGRRCSSAQLGERQPLYPKRLNTSSSRSARLASEKGRDSRVAPAWVAAPSPPAQHAHYPSAVFSAPCSWLSAGGREGQKARSGPVGANQQCRVAGGSEGLPLLWAGGQRRLGTDMARLPAAMAGRDSRDSCGSAACLLLVPQLLVLVASNLFVLNVGHHLAHCGWAAAAGPSAWHTILVLLPALPFSLPFSIVPPHAAKLEFRRYIDAELARAASLGSAQYS